MSNQNQEPFKIFIKSITYLKMSYKVRDWFNGSYISKDKTVSNFHPLILVYMADGPLCIFFSHLVLLD
jgi:hypothetical protein